jgi:hypothetical protein
MIGFVILLVVAIFGTVVYIAIARGARAARVDVADDGTGDVGEVEAARRHRSQVRRRES